MYKVSLGTLVPNSRDRHKNGSQTLRTTKIFAKIHFVGEKSTEMHL